VERRRGRRRKKLLDDLKDRKGYSHLKEEALDRTIWRHRFGGGFGPVVRQNIELMNECIFSSIKLLTRKFSSVEIFTSFGTVQHCHPPVLFNELTAAFWCY